ncbi:hypothetical protein E2C01_075511 [Portunus trituberculatus]|uniref:Secreted protein n=1 Tax=Portunus trituberculatus TaxID=210409 RepID=A0A5B7IKC9_PORTR|nr:hypothetical protein [Portunus trituberculatus]
MLSKLLCLLPWLSLPPAAASASAASSSSSSSRKPASLAPFLSVPLSHPSWRGFPHSPRHISFQNT